MSGRLSHHGNRHGRLSSHSQGKHVCEQLHTSMQGETWEGSNPSPHKEPGRVQPFPARGIGRGTSPSPPKYNGAKQTHGSVALSDSGVRPPDFPETGSVDIQKVHPNSAHTCCHDATVNVWNVPGQCQARRRSHHSLQRPVGTFHGKRECNQFQTNPCLIHACVHAAAHGRQLLL